MVRLPWEELPGSRWQVTDFFAGQAYEHSGDEMYYPGLYVDLPPWGFHILTATAIERVMATISWAQELEKKLDLPIYFAHPYHSWERGTNENTNGLLRQYLPKGTDLRQVTPEQLRTYVRQLNHRPRKCLDFQTAGEVFHAPPPG
jgi:hypothetical protein